MLMITKYTLSGNSMAKPGATLSVTKPLPRPVVRELDVG